MSDIPEPPQCERLLDCPSIPAEMALEATEYSVCTLEAEKRAGSLHRDKSIPEGCVAIEMSAQPLLELTPMTGSLSHCQRDTKIFVTPIPTQSFCLLVNSKELEAYHSEQRDEEEDTEEEEPPIAPKPVAPGSMFLFKASNP